MFHIYPNFIQSLIKSIVVFMCQMKRLKTIQNRSTSFEFSQCVVEIEFLNLPSSSMEYF